MVLLVLSLAWCLELLLVIGVVSPKNVQFVLRRNLFREFGNKKVIRITEKVKTDENKERLYS